MLRACRRLLEPGGRLAFATIYPAPGLSDRDYRRALALGPRAVATRRRRYSDLLAAAGLDAVRQIDVTSDFRSVAAELLGGELRHADELRGAVGDTAFDERVADLKRSLSGIDAGLLRRALFLARRPAEGVVS